MSSFLLANLERVIFKYFSAVKGRSLRLSGLVFLASISLLAGITNWRIDPAHSSAQFSVRHMMISTVRGQFGGVKGTVLYDPEDPAASSVEATIDTTTLDTGEPKRDRDLKSEQFFNVKRHPVMTFKSTHVEKVGAGKLKVMGDLTINGSTQQVVLEAEGPTPPIRDSRGRKKVGMNASTTISRKAFGMTYNPLLEGGGVTVGDEVAINLDLELIENAGLPAK